MSSKPIFIALSLLLGLTASFAAVAEEADPAEVAIGERLFRETRFNQYFASHSRGRVNADLPKGDPAIEQLTALDGTRFRNPYAGKGINCASCHFVDELQGLPGLGNLAYNDFAPRSRIPARPDRPGVQDFKTTLRNSPPFVNSALALDKDYAGRAMLMHFDAEFTSPEDLVRGGFTGRNFGWLADEADQAVAHLAKVIREDNGSTEFAKQYGGAYSRVLAGTDPALPQELRLPEEFRINVARSTDEQVMGAVQKLVGAYLRSILYSRDAETGEFNGSPYDAFLHKNGLPRKPAPGQSDRDYARLLGLAIETLPEVRYVEDGVDGRFELASQGYAFGPKELQGLKAFMGPANCVACHAPPAFTDFSFHNTGATQEEYDGIHGGGAFAALPVPRFADRIAHEDEVFGATPDHPKALGLFASVPEAGKPGLTDLGVWNVWGNPAMPKSQAILKPLLCMQYAKSQGYSDSEAATRDCSSEQGLEAAFAAFKTPNVRNLGQSAPYLHSGAQATVEEIVDFYVRMSALARAGRIRSADIEMTRVEIGPSDVAPLAAFLRSLNEDYK